jgi:hypothetical protein
MKLITTSVFQQEQTLENEGTPSNSQGQGKINVQLCMYNIIGMLICLMFGCPTFNFDPGT